MARQTMVKLKFSEGQVVLNKARDGWRKFVDALYAANSDVLPPREMVTHIAVDVEPGHDFPIFQFTIVGLVMPFDVPEEEADVDD